MISITRKFRAWIAKIKSGAVIELQNVEFDGEMLKTKDGIYIWTEVTRIWAMARDRITIHDIYYQFEFNEKKTIIFEEDNGIDGLIAAMRNLQGFDDGLYGKIFQAKITHGDYLLYERS